MAKRGKKRFRGKFYRINEYIQAPQIRVVDDKAKQIGVMRREEALKIAQEKGLDLVEVAPAAKPPVVKLINFKKFRYLEAKKRRQEKKSIKGGELKEIRLTPFIAKGDFEFRVKRAQEFLGEGNKVKVTVRFVGRQITRKEFGQELLRRFIKELELQSKSEHEPRWAGRKLFTTLAPVSRKKERAKEKPR